MLKKCLNKIVAVSAFMVVSLFAFGQATAAEIKWKMATSWGGGPIMELGAKQFAENVKFLSGGRIEIEVFTGGTLGSALKVSEAGRTGIARVGATWMG